VSGTEFGIIPKLLKKHRVRLCKCAFCFSQISFVLCVVFGIILA